MIGDVPAGRTAEVTKGAPESMVGQQEAYKSEMSQHLTIPDPCKQRACAPTPPVGEPRPDSICGSRGRT